MLSWAGHRVGARLPAARQMGLAVAAPARRCANGAGRQTETTTMRDYSGRKYNVPNDYLKNLEDERVPGLAYGLGLAGLVPFFFFGLAHGGGTGEDNYGNRVLDALKRTTGIGFGWFRTRSLEEARHWFLTYGACVLSFLGAVHWGAAMASPIYRPGMFIWSVIPTITGWVSVNMLQVDVGLRMDQAPGFASAAAGVRPEDVTVVSSTSGKQLPPEKAAEYTRKKYVYHGSYIGNSAIPLLSPYVLQAAGFVAAYVFDKDGIKYNIFPKWYRTLRLPLTLAVVATTAVAYWVPMGNEDMQAYGREELERTGLNKGWMSFSRTARLARGEMLSKMKDQESSDEGKQ